MYLKDNLRGSSSALHLSFYSSTVPLLLTPLSSYFIVFIFLFHSLSSHLYPFYSNSSSPTLSFHASSYSNFFLFSPLLLFISFILCFSSSSYTLFSSFSYTLLYLFVHLFVLILSLLLTHLPSAVSYSCPSASSTTYFMIIVISVYSTAIPVKLADRMQMPRGR